MKRALSGGNGARRASGVGLIIASAALLLVSQVPAAWAQSALVSAERVDQLEEVVVTATLTIAWRK